MKILQLKANNILRLTAVDITPRGNSVVLTGKNTAGKTSVLRAITSVLAGAKDRPDNLLHRGAEKGEITLTIGNTEPELIARLKVTPEGETLTVTTGAGAKYSTPQAILDGLRGAIGFEPMLFLQRDPKQQASMLQKLVGLNFAELDAEKQRLYDERTSVNRDVKQAETVYGTMPHHDIPQTEEVSVADLTERLQAALAKNAANKKAHEEVEFKKRQGIGIAEQITQQEAELLEMQKAIKRKEDAIESLKDQRDKVRDEYKAVEKISTSLKGTDIDVEPLNAQIATAEETNRKVRANKSHTAWSLQMDEKRNESARLTKEIEAIEKTKADQLKAADMPVKGLSFTADGVLLNDLPLESASGAEQLIVALGIGCKLNPKLRVLLFRDASLLDGDSRKIVEDFCDQHDMQAWLEVVDTDEPGAIVIEDGAIK